MQKWQPNEHTWFYKGNIIPEEMVCLDCFLPGWYGRKKPCEHCRNTGFEPISIMDIIDYERNK